VIEVFSRTSGALSRGVVSGVEFIDRVFDEFAALDRVYPEVVPDLWEFVPVTIQSEFAAVVRRAAAPEFRYRAFHYGGSRPATDEELRRDVDLPTARVQAWAVAFVRFLTKIEA
jgi:hypothetical protein